MSSCARCGQGICTTAGKIALNKVWHKGCFCCYNCNRSLRVNNAKIYYGEVFCSCCCPQIQEVFPKVCKVKSTPSFNTDCCPKTMKPPCCSNSSDDCCRVRDAHSCGCIPACCNPKYSPCNCQDCEEPCFKRIHCRPRSPKPINYPPRQQTPRCSCCSKPPKIKFCPPDKCYPVVRKKQPYMQCYDGKKAVGSDGKKKLIYFQPPDNGYSKSRNNWCKFTIDRCRRCGEKVFAAEKILTSSGTYHLSCFSCCCCCKSLCMKTMYEACQEIYCKNCYNNFFGISSYGYSCC